MKKYGILATAAVFAVVLAGCTAHKPSTTTTTTTGTTVATAAVAPVVDTTDYSTMNGSYKLDPASSTLTWASSKIVGDPREGTVGFKDGSLIYSGNMPTKGAFIIDMTTIKESTNSAMVENHLKSDDFFSVDKFPISVLTITGFTKASKVTGDNTYKVRAALTIKGHTNPLVFTASIVQNVATAKFVINRSLRDIRYGSPSFFNDLGDKAIKDNIDFTVKVTVRK